MWGPPNFFPPQNGSGYSGLLQFHINLKVVFSTSEKKKKAIGILTRVTSNLSVALGSINVLTILSFLIHEDGRAFHLFRPSFISFSNVL